MKKYQLMTEMIESCRDAILAFKTPQVDLPEALGQNHMKLMCSRMLDNLEKWPMTKLNRWLGFVQCAMIANGIITLDEAKSMFDNAKKAFGEPSADLKDHLDPDHPFEFDIGGQG